MDGDNLNLGDNDLSEEEMEHAIYCYEHLKFTLSGQHSVPRLSLFLLSSSCASCIFLISISHIHSVWQNVTWLLNYFYKYVHSLWFCCLLVMLTITSPLTQQQEIQVELSYDPALGNSPDPHCCQTRVLGHNMLPAIWHDMGKAVLPSWLPASPKEAGLAPSGKLSADQWRTTCTVHLVVTLGRTWGVL